MTSQWSADDDLLTKVSLLYTLLLLSSPLFISSFLHPLPLLSQSPKVNVEGTNNIIRLCLEKKFKKLVYPRFYLISSSSSYFLSSYIFDLFLSFIYYLISLIQTMYTSSIAAYAPPHGSYITEKSLKLGEFILLFFYSFLFILFYFFL